MVGNKRGAIVTLLFTLSVVAYSLFITPRSGPVSDSPLSAPYPEAFQLSGWDSVSYQYYLWWLGKEVGDYELKHLGLKEEFHMLLDGRPELVPGGISRNNSPLLKVEGSRKFSETVEASSLGSNATVKCRDGDSSFETCKFAILICREKDDQKPIFYGVDFGDQRLALVDSRALSWLTADGNKEVCS